MKGCNGRCRLSRPGTALMHEHSFPKGKAHFVPVDHLPPGESPSEAYPFVLITGRILQHYNCGAQTRRTGIIQLVDTDVLEMHPSIWKGWESPTARSFVW